MIVYILKFFVNILKFFNMSRYSIISQLAYETILTTLF